MTSSIERSMPHGFQEVAIGTTVGASAPVQYEGASGGRIFIPSGSSITELTFYDTPNQSESLTYYPSYDDQETPAAVKLTNLSAGNSYPIPDAMFGARMFKMVGNAAGYVYVVTKG